LLAAWVRSLLKDIDFGSSARETDFSAVEPEGQMRFVHEPRLQVSAEFVGGDVDLNVSGKPRVAGFI